MLFENIHPNFFKNSPVTLALWGHALLFTFRQTSRNSRHHLRTCCTIITSLPYASIWCISVGEMFFAHTHRITLCGTQVDERDIASSIITVLLQPVLPTGRYEKKNQCCSFKPINIP